VEIAAVLRGGGISLISEEIDMEVKLYGKPGCKLCSSAEDKLLLMEIPYEKYDINYFLMPHEGWRDDGSEDVQAMHCLINQQIPMVVINNEPYSYASAMRVLKKLSK
jgi:hypothetical protein